MLSATGLEIPTGGTYPLLGDQPDDVKPEKIIYAKFILDTESTKYNVHFSMEDCGEVAVTPGNISGSLNDLIARRCGTSPIPYRPHPTHPPGTIVGTRPIKGRDIPIDKQCYVVVELSEKSNWQFRTDGPAITSKDQIIDHRDGCGLMHVNYDGSKNSDKATHNNCRIAYFKILQGTAGDWQGFNLHVEIIEDIGQGDFTGTIFDPDVPNVGTFP